MLRAKKISLIKDVERLKADRETSLTDPLKVVQELLLGKPLNFIPLRTFIPDIPYIDISKYVQEKVTEGFPLTSESATVIVPTERTKLEVPPEPNTSDSNTENGSNSINLTSINSTTMHETEVIAPKRKKRKGQSGEDKSLIEPSVNKNQNRYLYSNRQGTKLEEGYILLRSHNLSINFGLMKNKKD